MERSGLLVTRIEKNWENFLKFTKRRTINYQGKEYLIAQRNFFDQIISDLIINGFLKRVGRLSQIIKNEERKKIGGLSDFSGNTTTYEILKPFID